MGLVDDINDAVEKVHAGSQTIYDIASGPATGEDSLVDLPVLEGEDPRQQKTISRIIDEINQEDVIADMEAIRDEIATAIDDYVEAIGTPGNGSIIYYDNATSEWKVLVAQSDKLLTYTGGALSWVDPDSFSDRTLVYSSSVAGASFIAADNIFNSSLYDHYIFRGEAYAFSNNVGLRIRLRDAATINSTRFTMSGMETGPTVNTISASVNAAQGIGTGAGFGVKFMGEIEPSFTTNMPNSINVRTNFVDTSGSARGSVMNGETIGDYTSLTNQGVRFDFDSGLMSSHLRIWGVKKV